MSDAPFEAVFHFEGGGAEWAQLRVVSFTLEEELSRPYELRVVLHARGPENEVDPDALLGALATLRIATLSEPGVRSVHGLIAEVAEIGATRYGMLLEVWMVPPVCRGTHRSRSRIFLEKTTRQIVEAVLTGDERMGWRTRSRRRRTR
jgi:type VI secretion system secreted protein VgrG